MKVARISVGLGGLMTLVFLLARNIYVFGLGMFLMALWASFYHPTANGLIAKAFPENTGGAMGIHNAAGNFGQVFTPTVSYFLGVRYGWRVAFVFFGLLSVVTAWTLDRIKVDEGESSAARIGYLEYLRTPGLWIVLVYNCMVGYLFRSVDMFFPTFLTVERGVTGQLAAVANSAILLFGVGGQLIGGRGSDKYGQTRTLVAVTAGMVVSLFGLMLLPGSNLGVMFFIVGYGLSMFGHQPTVTSLVSKISPRHMMGLSYGVMFFSAFGVGSLSTTVTGYLADSVGLSAAFWLNTGIAVVLLAVSVVMLLRIKE